MHWLTKHHLERKRRAANPQPMIEVAVLHIVPNEDKPLPALPTAFWCGSQEKVALSGTVRVGCSRGFLVAGATFLSTYFRTDLGSTWHSFAQ